jgi:hypothetical protein
MVNSLKNGRKMDEKWMKNGQKWAKNGRKMDENR